MNNALLIKQIDLSLQIVVTVLSIGAVFLVNNDVSLFIPYLAVGAVQLTSCLANLCFGKQNRRYQQRSAYNAVLVVIGVLAGLSPLIQLILGIMMYGMLIVSPCLAVWYLAITAKELKSLLEQKRVLNL